MKTPIDFRPSGLPRAVHSRWTIEGLTQTSTSEIVWEKLLLGVCDCTGGATDSLAAFYHNGPAHPMYIQCMSCGTAFIEVVEEWATQYEKMEDPWIDMDDLRRLRSSL
jgi:hypothetical protein